MVQPSTPAKRRVLDPTDRVAEILFGLIMALSFTGTIEVATADREEVSLVLYAALGCNLAWGLVDGVMYVVLNLVERSRRRGELRAFAAAASDDDARVALAAAVPSQVVTLLDAAALGSLRARAAEQAAATQLRVTGADLAGAIGVFLLVVLATFPVVIPYLAIEDTMLARRLSNAVTIVLLYACGHMLGRHALGRPVATGVAMVGIGVVLVGTTIALGG
jgi:hypothetical protein